MADVTLDLATYLDANSTLAAGTDLFTNDMPPVPDAVTVLYETPGAPPIETLGTDSQPAVITPRVQIQARAATHDAARTRIREVYALLVVITNESVNGVAYLRVAPLQEPFLLRRDEQERTVFAFNAEVWREAE